MTIVKRAPVDIATQAREQKRSYVQLQDEFAGKD